MAGEEKPSPWRKTESRLLLDCRIFKLVSARFCHPVRRSAGDFTIIEAPDWVNVAAVTSEGEIVAISQYRFGIENLTLEVPAGMIEDGEDPLDAGMRELREETGYAGEKAELLGWIYPNPAIQNNRCYFVAVHDARRVQEPEWDEHEEIQTLLYPLGQVPGMLERGEFNHSLTACAIQSYLAKYPL